MYLGEWIIGSSILCLIELQDLAWRNLALSFLSYITISIQTCDDEAEEETEQAEDEKEKAGVEKKEEVRQIVEFF